MRSPCENQQNSQVILLGELVVTCSAASQSQRTCRAATLDLVGVRLPCETLPDSHHPWHEGADDDVRGGEGL